MTGRTLLRTWIDHAQIYRVLHSSASAYFELWDGRYKIPAILMTSVGAGLAFSVQVFPRETSLYVPVFVGVLNLVAGTFTSVASFRKTAERSEGHRIAAVQYSKLRRKIQEKLTLNEDIKDDFVSAIREDLDSLIESGPEIPELIIEAFREKHKNTTLKKPSIVHLGGLDVAHLDMDHHRPIPLIIQETIGCCPDRQRSSDIKLNIVSENKHATEKATPKRVYEAPAAGAEEEQPIIRVHRQGGQNEDVRQEGDKDRNDNIQGGQS